MVVVYDFTVLVKKSIDLLELKKFTRVVQAKKHKK
jgi:hypothetical protein